MSHLNSSSPRIRAVIILFALMIAFAAVQTPVLAYDVSLGQLSIPSIEVSTSIVQAPIGYPSWDLTRLGSNVGHLEGTAWVDRPGNIIIAGHSTTPELAPSIFANLHLLNVGDEIIMTVNGVERRYIVDRMSQVAETDLSILMPTQGEQLTLLTCAHGSYNAASGAYTERTIVIATPA